MKGILTLKKSAVVAAVCMAVLCMQGYSEPTPEQIAERTNLLIQAIENNNVEQAKVCIKLGADVNTNVYYYKYYSNVYLTTNRNDIPYYDVGTYTLLTYAVEYNKSKDIIELLAKAGADLNAKNDFDRTALMECASRGYVDMAEILIKAGADVNAKSEDGSTALHMTSSIVYSYEKKVEVYKDMVELLVKSGADVNAKNGYGSTAILSAAGIGVKDVVELLIKAGADVNGDYPVLIDAARAGNKDVIELLIKAGADINAKSNTGATALKFAKNKEIAEALIKAGADGDAVLILAVKQTHGDYAFVEMLINAGVNPNAKDSEGISALTYAILYGNNGIAELLRAAGAKE